MNVTVIGTGYVGLVTGACFAEMGNTVYCIDTDVAKISSLKNGVIPIYEPGLENIVQNNHAAGRLIFDTDIAAGLDVSEVIFIAVGTPPGEDGSADLQYVLAVADEIGSKLEQYAVIVDKSTVPVGTADQVRQTIATRLSERAAQVEFDVVSNPEFLKEGAAVEDFMRPDRIIVGANSSRAKDIMHELYAPFTRSHERIIYMGVRDAEMTKYAANAMLATKISFMNEIASLCDAMDIDVENVRLGIGADSRIGYSFIYPGAGYGGSCFPKDVKALIHMASSTQIEPWVLHAVEQRNYRQKRVLFEKLNRYFDGDLSGKTLALWGLAFKPGTDDMREAPSKVLLQQVIDAGAQVQAYDPVASETARKELPQDWFQNGKLQLLDNQYKVLENADALILITEWKPFRHPDFALVKRTLRSAVIFDGRNQYDPEQLRDLGFDYFGIGR